MDVILLLPGQGSQKPGMGRDVAEAFTAARAVFDEADATLGESLSTICFEGPASDLGLTHNAQPALLAHSAAVLAAVGDLILPRLKAAAGHSLGEFSAYHAAGSLTFEAAIRLVRQRGQLMHAAAVARPGAMAALLGENISVEDLCARASGDGDGGLVVPANFNSPGQVVVSGETAGVRKAVELAPLFGAKHTVPLAVSGAFHSPLMESAREGLGRAIASTPFGDPRVPVYANVTASPVNDALRARQLLLDQLTGAVRWTETVQRLADRFPGALFVELGTGNVLVKLVRKIAPAVQTMSCGTVPEIESLRAKLT
ncbi:MAG: ACP S-malonyltransferase [Gemmatimonadota bacterium]